MSLTAKESIVAGDGPIELIFTIETDIDITDLIPHWTLRAPNSGYVIVSKEGQVIDAEAKRVMVILEKEDTKNLCEGRYTHGMTFVNPDGSEYSIQSSNGKSFGILPILPRIAETT